MAFGHYHIITGEVASKNVVNMRHKMLDAVRAALSKAKSAKQDEEADEDEERRLQKKKEETAADSGKYQKEQPKLRKGGKDARKTQQAEAAGDSDEDVGPGDSEDEREGGTDGDDESEDADGAVAAALAAVKLRQGGVLQRASNPEAKKMKQQRDREKVKGHGRAGSSPADMQEEAEAAPKAAKQPAAMKTSGGKVPYSADALEDDFGDIVEFEPEEDKLTLSKKERMKKVIKQGKAKRKAERLAGTGGLEDPDGLRGGVDDGQEGAEAMHAKSGGKKRPKVVTF
ncbi:hypothetical protein Vretimale_8479 [Volvox reticuliferus]|uniref:Uncharacterized protein n=1 Tax=Volvox reticuliferus TaxID=1737510 RepID=A0A8J4FNX8_9CHLO|nr:hypothetical protein Vretifemale_11638 [Volvox reticuliferus]GIM03783.1 hypothetical protein Vretimale_8479 [Volvox reticuliferus]